MLTEFWPCRPRATRRDTRCPLNISHRETVIDWIAKDRWRENQSVLVCQKDNDDSIELGVENKFNSCYSRSFELSFSTESRRKARKYRQFPEYQSSSVEDATATINRHNYSILLDTPNWRSSLGNANRKWVRARRREGGGKGRGRALEELVVDFTDHLRANHRLVMATLRARHKLSQRDEPLL